MLYPLFASICVEKILYVPPMDFVGLETVSLTVEVRFWYVPLYALRLIALVIVFAFFPK